jgi:hypothetical protein
MGKISEIALFQQSETYALVVETRTTVKEIAMTIGRSFMEIETLFKEQNAVILFINTKIGYMHSQFLNSFRKLGCRNFALRAFRQ